jgi:hypothetical protein
MAARGGLEGGDGRPVDGTSGIPLCPYSTFRQHQLHTFYIKRSDRVMRGLHTCGNGRAVQEASEAPCSVDEVAGGEDVGAACRGDASVLAVITGIGGIGHC